MKVASTKEQLDGPPQLSLGLFLCQRVIVDRADDSRTVVGIFETVSSDAFPLTLPPFEVFATLTDGQGRITLDLVVTRLNDHEQLAARPFSVVLSNPLEVVPLRLQIRRLTIPEPGQYLFELLLDDVSICHRRLNVRLEGE